MNKLIKPIFIFSLLIGFSSCEDDVQLPDNLVQFESDQLGLLSSESELVVNINFSREATQDGTIIIATELTGLEYGLDFTTDPAVEDNKIALPIVAGTTSTSFKIIKANGVVLIGDELVKFTIESVFESVVLGEKNELTLTFAEIIANIGSISPTVGGEAQPNKVFVDLSGSRQSFISRSAWDLGFHTDGGSFKVVLNSSSGMMAQAIDETDLNAVTAADTVGFGGQQSLSAIFSALFGPPPAWFADALSWVDDPAGDLSKTAFAEVSAIESENKVYIVNRGTNADGSERGWKKVRVLRNGDGYTVRYADIAATSFATIEVSRDNAFLFNYINFDGGLVEAEPKKDLWDIAFTVFTNSFPSNPGDPMSPVIPFEFKDYIIQNRFNVETALVMTSTVSYENFAEADLSGITFETAQNNIGSSWRTIPSNSTTPPSLNADRFYIIKDPAGNIYKLRFTALTQAGERGFPAFEYELVIEG